MGDNSMAFFLEDEDEQEDNKDLPTVVALVAGVSENIQSSFFVRARIEWYAAVCTCQSAAARGPGAFSRLYRMGLQSCKASFYKLIY